MQSHRKRHSDTIRLGFVPLVDCASIAVAYETGLFQKRGLNVELMREPGWATIRDKMAYGELEAVHAPVGLAFALNWGLGVLKHPCSTGYLLNSNGDAITISKSLHDEGIVDPESLAHRLKTTRQERPFTFGVPHLFSTHHFLLLQWLRPAGILANHHIDIAVLPPSLMTSCLAAGNIDGYCVGEPFNTMAVREGSGVILAESADLSPMHPEKALIVSDDFNALEHETHLEMIRAIDEAAVLCETHDGREQAVEILSQPHYLGIEPGLIRSSLFAGEDSEVSSESFHIFSHPDVNRPDADKANWLVAQMRNAGLLNLVNTKAGPPLSHIFREDLFDEAMSSLTPAS
ncbi:MAG: CmpA/NrtA family ABC transporter substrate-binding protein [Verrucomicrobiales bacterium]|nr:CmpA/NrtA family ABC transporter substrate-binding protein [Verrucomicrobiales bacterium]